MGVAPWELIDKPVAWRDYALAAERAEIVAQNKAQERAQKSAQRKRR